MPPPPARPARAPGKRPIEAGGTATRPAAPTAPLPKPVEAPPIDLSFDALGDRAKQRAAATPIPDEALEKSPLGPRSAIVLLSHDPKIDDPGLIAALKSNCFYIGTLGSKKTQAARQARAARRGRCPASPGRTQDTGGRGERHRSPRAGKAQDIEVKHRPADAR